MTSEVRAAGARVEELLGSLRSGGFGPAAAAAEELVGLLVGLYGDGLTRITEILAEQGEAGSAILARLADDPQVEGLLLLHDLHPLNVDARIQRALDRVRPYLGSHAGGVEYLGVSDGAARLRLEGSCNGCPSSTVTVQLAITTAVEDAAPEVTDVVVEGMTAAPEPSLLQIGRRPPDATAPDSDPPAESGAAWVTLPNIGPPSSRPVSATADGTQILVCAVRGTLYAYLDACAVCGSSLAAGTLNREELTCPACATTYNVRLAGKSVTDAAAHLNPLPLLSDSQGVRVALPEPGGPPVTRQTGLRRFARPAPGQAGPPEPPAATPPSSAEAAASTLPPLVAELLQAAAPEDAAPRPGPDAERCELCKVGLPAEHGHVADLENQSLVCACRACYLLFTRPNTSHIRYRAIPDRYLTDPARALTPAQFDELEIPVGLAFFLRSTAAGRVVGFYPSPAGATECVLDLGAWERLTAEHPLLAEPEADVEAALISRADGEGGGVEYFLVPVDACYELVGRMRLQWRGFDGGAEARASITDFLEQVRSRARVFAEAQR